MPTLVSTAKTYARGTYYDEDTDDDDDDNDDDVDEDDSDRNKR